MEVVEQGINLRNLDKSDWEVYRFDEIADKVSERVDPNDTDLNVYVGLEHIDPESIHLKRTGTSDDVKGTKLRFYPGDVIFGRRRAYQRKAAIAECDGFCSAHALVLRANPEVIDPKLFPFFIHSDQFMYRAVDISVGSLSPTINWGTLKNQEFRIPPKDHQVQLAELLWAGDSVIKKEINVFNSLGNSREIYLSELFDGRHKRKHFKLKELYKQKFNSVNPENYGDEIVHHYSLPSYEEKHAPDTVSASSIKSNKILIDKETVLFSKLNPSDPKVWPVKKEGDYKKLGSTEWLPVNTNKELSLNYIHAFLSSQSFLYKVMRFVQGSSNSHKRVNPKMFYNLKIPVLGDETVALIENSYLRFQSSIVKAQSNIANSKLLQKKLINRIF